MTGEDNEGYLDSSYSYRNPKNAQALRSELD